MDNGKKNTPQVFTTNDIRKHARNWTLAGDVGLLAHLEQFSENIINKTEETQKNLSKLVNDYEELYTKVGNVTNQFLALQNCQFVENRVYDEETPTEEKTEVKVPDEAEQEKLLLMQYKKAVEVGVKLLDTHFQEIQLPPNSDSDEEDEVSAGNSVIWKPKNLYAGKKFPLLIGSAEWWADDHVGLGPSEEILDSDKVVSESESDIESLKSIDKPLKSSSSSSTDNMNSIPTKPSFLESSEDLFGFNKSRNVKGVPDDPSKFSNSLLEEPSDFLPGFDKEPNTEASKRTDSFNEDQPSEQVEKKQTGEGTTNKPEKVDNEFTRELVAKLVSVTNKKKEESKERAAPAVEKSDENLFDETDDSSDLFSSKIHKVKDRPPAKNLFFDAENDDDLFKGKSALFSGSGLFESDGLEDNESQIKERKNLESTVESKIRERKEVVEPKKSLINDLFDDLDDDDTLFSVKPVNNKKADQSLPPMENGSSKVAKAVDPPGMFWDDDEGLFDSINTEIDHNFADSSDLFDSKANKLVESKVSADFSKSKEKMSDFFPNEPEINRKPDKVVDLERKESISDSHRAKKSAAEDSFDDLFGFPPSMEQGNEKISILNTEKDDDLFSKSLKEEKKPPVKIVTLAEDEDIEEAILFGEKSKPPDSVSVSSSRSSLFDDVSASKSRLASVFEKDKSNKPEDDLFSEPDASLFAGEAKSQEDLFSKGKEKKSSLFDDWDDGDDLFSAGKKEDSEVKSSSGNPLVDSIKNIEKDNFEREKQPARGVKSFIDTSGDDDLFTSSAATKPRETKSDILRHSSQKLFVDDLEDAELFSDNAKTIKPKPPSSLSLRVTETESKSKTVGKLNIPDNLKFRFESAAKNISQRAVKPSEEEKTKKEEEKKEEVLDESVQVSTLLKCPSKDRVKIPGRRRPQSRRARQEAIRNSGTWDQSISPSSASTVTETRKDSLSSPVKSNPLSPSTDEEDFFKVPELDTNFEKEDQSIFKSDLFESSKASTLDDSLLFDGAPVLSPSSPKKADEPAKKDEPAKSQQTNSLFGSAKPKTKSLFDDDDDDDLYADDEDSLFKTPKPPIGDLQPRTEGKLKKALFDDGDDDDDKDDLFGGTSRVNVKPPVLDKPREESEPKEKGSSSFVDPLGLMKVE